MFATDPPARAVTKLGVELSNLLVSIMMTAHVERVSEISRRHRASSQQDDSKRLGGPS